MKYRILGLLLALVGSSLFVLETVYAQASPESSPELTVTPVNTTSTLNTLKETYRGQLAEYRTAERTYQIAAQQYRELNTLVSLEAVLQAMKKAMILRDQVLITYLTILQTQLGQATGINLDQKTSLNDNLTNTNQLVSDHLQSTQGAETKEQIVAAASEFEVVGKQTETTSYLAQTILAIGRLQTVYDKATVLTDDLDKNLVATTVDIKQAERQRAIAEVKATLSNAKQEIEYLLSNQSQISTRATLQSALRNLNVIYQDLIRSLDYLDELLRL